ncbi:MAG: DUF2878 domain-containing protein [Salinisphaera sp.]|nr:DUF2878 domain-containing protein [Salinisphaera sp.]
MNGAVLNLLLFHSVWVATVWAAAAGRAWIGLAAVLVFAVWELPFSPHARRELTLMALVVPLGWAADSAYVALDLLRYAEPVPGPPFAPWWIAILWANFSLVVNRGLAWLAGRPWLAALFGAVGGPLAYYGAEKLGGVDFVASPFTVLAVLAIVWAIAIPAIFALNRRLQSYAAAGASA